MTQIRENIYKVEYSELDKPAKRGYYALPDKAGELLIDEADLRYIREYLEKGYEPTFFVSKSAGINGGFVVVSRQWL